MGYTSFPCYKQDTCIFTARNLGMFSHVSYGGHTPLRSNRLVRPSPHVFTQPHHLGISSCVQRGYSGDAIWKRFYVKARADVQWCRLLVTRLCTRARSWLHHRAVCISNSFVWLGFRCWNLRIGTHVSTGGNCDIWGIKADWSLCSCAR